MQTSLRYMTVHDRLIAAVASIRAYVVLRSIAATHAVLVTAFTLTVVIILGGRALWHAVRAIPGVFAFLAMLRVRSGARTIALLVADLAGLLVRLIDSRKCRKNDYSRFGERWLTTRAR